MYDGWYPTAQPLMTRLLNLAEQIPPEQRAAAFAECCANNPHDFERNLTGYVLRRKSPAFIRHPWTFGLCRHPEVQS